MIRKQRLSGEDRRSQLIAVGREVFAKHGYDAASVEEIARAAGVSKPIVYEHFGGKEGLYAVVVDREMDALVERITKEISDGTPRKRFEGAVRAFLTYVKEEPDGFAVLTKDPPIAHSRRGLTRVISDLGDRVGDIFQIELKKAGMNPKVGPIYSHALIGMVTEVGQWWAGSKGLSVDQVARHVAALGWMGLRHLPKEPKLSA